MQFGDARGFQRAPAARRTVNAINPFLGRPVRDEIRELVIAWGQRGYAALYRVRETSKDPGLRVEVLAIRHQREAGYR